jgi:ribonuclease HII
MALKTCMFPEDNELFEIGIDESGRGPLFGRVYTAAVVLPKTSDAFHHEWMKDSKRFSSKKKMAEVAEYIKANAVSWAVTYQSEKEIDEKNILNATMDSMHASVKEVVQKLEVPPRDEKTFVQLRKEPRVHLLVDGNYFRGLLLFQDGIFQMADHTCVTKGDNTYTAIAAASILAKVARDQYVHELCVQHPELVERYHLDTNKGYGTSEHMNGLRQHGPSPWHRTSFNLSASKKPRRDAKCLVPVE